MNTSGLLGIGPDASRRLELPQSWADKIKLLALVLSFRKQSHLRLGTETPYLLGDCFKKSLHVAQLTFELIATLAFQQDFPLKLLMQPVCLHRISCTL
jgi:hypothetical protein